jgi:hypothetical protein
LSPAAKRRAVDMLKSVMGISERLAGKAVGLARSTYQHVPIAQTAADPDADLRAWLRNYSTASPCHGFRRAWAALRHDEHRTINKKKVQRLWAEEGLQRRVHSRRKRTGASSHPQVSAGAPKVVWALDFQFDSTIDGKTVKIASMLDEHTRESLMNIAERLITAERLIEDLERSFTAAGGPPMVLRMDNGPEMISQALQQFCDDKVGFSYIPPATPWNNRFIESFNNRLRKELPQPQPLDQPAREARVAIADFKHGHNSASAHRQRQRRRPHRRPRQPTADT